MTTLIQVPADEPRARSAGSRVKYALLLSAALGCAMAAGSSNAAAADGNAAAADGAVRTLVVKFSADTLDTDQGVHVLYHKLVRAADKVCRKPRAARGSATPCAPAANKRWRVQWGKSTIRTSRRCMPPRRRAAE